MSADIRKPELLAPAGDFEKLKTAIAFGADAVYFGGLAFGMRATAATFDRQTMREAVEYAHDRQVRCYITVNAIPHNDEIDSLPKYLTELAELGVDALIIGDPGVFALAKRYAPEIPIHISVQANVTNYASAQFWAKQGASRIIVSRELSLAEIARIRGELPNNIELEAFVHGAMCLSVSGRCYLSSYLTGRDANRGECAQPCRSKYALVEERRPFDYLPVFEDDAGAYILNANDLCMIEYIPELTAAGISSFKIEGRAKSAFYTGTVISAYRAAIDGYVHQPEGYKVDARLLGELAGVSHRKYDTGFYFDAPPGQNPGLATYLSEFNVVGVVTGCTNAGVTVQQRNCFSVGDSLEAHEPDGLVTSFTLTDMTNVNGLPIDRAPHPQMIVNIPQLKLAPGAFIRKRHAASGKKIMDNAPDNSSVGTGAEARK